MTVTHEIGTASTATPGAGQLTLLNTTPRAGRQGGYLAKKCPEYNAKENMPVTYPADLKEPYSEFTLDIMNAGNDFEDRIGTLLEKLAVRPEQVAIIAEARTPTGERTVEGKQAKEADTLAAVLDPNIRVIFNARFASHFEALLAAHRNELDPELDPDRVSEPDMLVKVLIDGVELLAPIDIKDHAVTSGAKKNADGSPKEGKPFAASPLSDPANVTWHNGIELAGQLRKEDWMQLAHYRRHMETMGLVDDTAPNWGAVIGREEQLVWAKLTDRRWLAADAAGRRTKQSAMEMYDDSFAKQLAVVVNARLRDVDSAVPGLTSPEWKTDCKECPWRTVCLQELSSYGNGGHVSLLPGVTPTGGGSAESALALYEAGLDEVGSLARHSPDHPVDGIRDIAKLVYQARVTMSGKVYRAPGVDHVEMPRADIEIDFDLENSGGGWVKVTDTLSGEVTDERQDPLLYMFSIRANGREQVAPGQRRERCEEVTYDDYSNTPEGELKVYTDTWAYFQKMLAKADAKGYSIRFYHYTKHEWTWLKNLAVKHAGKPGVPTLEEVLEFLESGLVVDMYAILAKQLVWPTKSHSIKDLAKHIRYTWNVDGQVGGDQSIAWHKAACFSDDPAARDAAIDKLRRYGQSDVEAQTKLREWICELGTSRPGTKLPNVTELKPPVAPRSRARRSA